jgi:hypothetical protein
MSDFKVEVLGDQDLKMFIQNMKINVGSANFNQAFLDSSLVAEREAKKALNRMVYELPESPSYKRTHELFRRTVASGVIKAEAGGVSTSVGSFISYAGPVHLGLGTNRKIGPRPFLTEGADNAMEEITEIMSDIFED